jgi:hypothetical protein
VVLDEAAEVAASQLSKAIRGMTGSKRALVTMSASAADRLCCALAALSRLCTLKQAESHSSLDGTMFSHADAVLDSLIDHLPGHLAGASKLGLVAQKRCLYTAAQCLQSAEPLITLRSAIGGTNIRTRLRSLLSSVARHATVLAPTPRSAEGAACWGWDVRQDANPLQAKQKGIDATIVLCQQLAHLLAACSIAQRCDRD